MRPFVPAAIVACALILPACGTESVDVPAGDASAAAGAEVFASNCAGCHTMTPAGSNGSGNRALRAQGPNFDQRVLGFDEVLFAIRNGGYSGAIMPQNIVVGEDASLVAEFVSKYSGTEAEDSPRPSPEPGSAEEGAAEDTLEAEGTEGVDDPTAGPDDGRSESAPGGAAQGAGPEGQGGAGAGAGAQGPGGGGPASGGSSSNDG